MRNKFAFSGEFLPSMSDFKPGDFFDGDSVLLRLCRDNGSACFKKMERRSPG